MLTQPCYAALGLDIRLVFTYAGHLIFKVLANTIGIHKNLALFSLCSLRVLENIVSFVSLAER